MTSEKARENRLRRLADRWGYSLRKDRARMLGIDHRGGYMIVDASLNAVVRGAQFDESLDDVEKFLAEEEATQRTEARS